MSADADVILCRLCQKSGLWYVNIFRGNGTDGPLVSDVIREVTQLQAHKGDGLPSTVCHECCKKLGDFRDFKEMCVKSADNLLRKRITTVIKVEEDDFSTDRSTEANDTSGGDLVLRQSNNENASPSLLLRPVEVFLNASTDCDMAPMDYVLASEIDPLGADDKPSDAGVAPGTAAGTSVISVRLDLSSIPAAAGTSSSNRLSSPIQQSAVGHVSHSGDQSQPAAAEKPRGVQDSTVTPSGTQRQQNPGNAVEACKEEEVETGGRCVTWPAHLPVFADSATEDESLGTSTASIKLTPLETQRGKNHHREQLKLSASNKAFTNYFGRKRLNTDSIEIESDSRKKASMANCDSQQDESMASDSQTTETRGLESMDQAVCQLREEISELERKRDALPGVDLKAVVREVVSEIVRPDINATKERIAALDRKLDGVSGMMSQSSGSGQSSMSVPTELENGPPVRLVAANGVYWEMLASHYAKLSALEGRKPDWCNALLHGCFPNKAHLMGFRPRKKSGKTPFPDAFLSAAKGLWVKVLLKNNMPLSEALAKAEELPGYLSDRCHEMRGPRGLAKKLKEVRDAGGDTSTIVEQMAQRRMANLAKKAEKAASQAYNPTQMMELTDTVDTWQNEPAATSEQQPAMIYERCQQKVFICFHKPKGTTGAHSVLKVRDYKCCETNKRWKLPAELLSFYRLPNHPAPLPEEDHLLVVERILCDAANPIERYSDVDFFKRFSFSKKTVTSIILPMIPVGGVQPAPNTLPALKLLITLRYYATSSFQAVSNEMSNLRPTLVHEIIKFVAKSIALKLPNWVKMPMTKEEISKHRNRFYHIAEFPRVIGCIDCTHIPVINPGGQHSALFLNRKKWFSMNVQVVFGSSMEIMDIVCRWYGSVHDSQIFLQSRLKSRFVSKELQGLLLGDSAYPLLPYLYTPVATPVCGPERQYNIAHARTMNVVVKGLRMWKQRFPCLLMKPRIKLSTSLKVIISTAILHNVAVSQGEALDDLEYCTFSEHVPVSDYKTVDTFANRERSAFIQRRFLLDKGRLRLGILTDAEGFRTAKVVLSEGQYR